MVYTFREEHKIQVFGNKVVRKINVPTKDEVCEKFNLQHTDNLCDLCRSHSIVGLVKPRRKQWAREVTEFEKYFIPNYLHTNETVFINVPKFDFNIKNAYLGNLSILFSNQFSLNVKHKSLLPSLLLLAI